MDALRPLCHCWALPSRYNGSTAHAVFLDQSFNLVRQLNFCNQSLGLPDDWPLYLGTLSSSALQFIPPANTGPIASSLCSFDSSVCYCFGLCWGMPVTSWLPRFLVGPEGDSLGRLTSLSISADVIG